MANTSKLLSVGVFLSLTFAGFSAFAETTDGWSSAIGANSDEIPEPSGMIKYDVKGNIDHFGSGTIEAAEVKCDGAEIGFCTGGCGTNSSKKAKQGRGGGGNAKISKDFAEYIDVFLPKCLEEIGCTGGAKFCGVGGHAKRNARNSGGNNKGGGSDTGTPSRHSTGDAMDIAGMRCNNGTKIEFTKDGVTDNYKKFTTCWTGQLKVARQSSEWGNKLLPQKGKGCITCKNSGLPTADKDSDHDDHIHMSVPFKKNRDTGNLSGT